MNKRDLLLEVGLEEMPARFVTNSMNQLASKVQHWLEESKIPFDEVKAFSTPRRLAILVLGLAESQEDIQEEAKGPAKKIAVDESGNWSKAAMGFCRGQGMSVDDIYFKEINGVEYVHVRKFIEGQETINLLVQLEKIVTGLSFPKNMRWASLELRYIRPIKWIVALFGSEVVPFTIANVESSNSTKGHRFLGHEITITDASKYEEALLGQYVVVQPTERKKAIVSQIKRIEEEKNWIIPIDEELLEEVNNLVEYPTALFGTFEEEFLDIPEEVLITSMKEHQRYFPVKSTSGKLLPFFVTVRNGDHNHLEKVAKGNEKVLRARLADAAFFYREDQKSDIADLQKKLGNIVYHEEIGTLAKKVERVRRLTNTITEIIGLSVEEKEAADRAAEISKFDLVTHMVYEFPELQGFMGEKYALQKGEKEAVAVAINEHYMPRNADDQTPASNVGAVLAITEKLDTIVSFMAIGVTASGSQDPYALRRQAAGIIQTLSKKEWEVSFEDLVDEAINLVTVDNISKRTNKDLKADIISFFKLRLKHLLQERGIRYDLIEAVLGTELGSIPGLFKKAEVLEQRKETPNFKENIEALSRVLNISAKAEEIGEINPELFENEFETDLFDAYVELKSKLVSVEPDLFFDTLVTLKPRIDGYFDHIMVMAEQPEIKKNRLNMMVKIADLINVFAKVNEIMVK
jgi:glycyl-tRNA synthetase beta chain